MSTGIETQLKDTQAILRVLEEVPLGQSLKDRQEWGQERKERATGVLPPASHQSTPSAPSTEKQCGLHLGFSNLHCS